MSVNNYRICPKCLSNFKEKEENLNSLYGKIDYSEFKKKLAEVETERLRLKPTFKEGYEIYSGQDEEVILNITYSGKCSKCGFSFNYNKKIDMITGKEL